MQRADAPQFLLLFGHWHEFAVRVVDKAERWLAAQVLAPRLLRALGGADALADAVALEHGEGGHDGQEQPRDPVAQRVVGAAAASASPWAQLVGRAPLCITALSKLLVERGVL